MTTHVSEEEFALNAVSLLARVKGGETVLVTKDGVVVASFAPKAAPAPRKERLPFYLPMDDPRRAAHGLPTKSVPVPDDLDDASWTEEIFGFPADPNAE